MVAIDPSIQPSQAPSYALTGAIRQVNGTLEWNSTVEIPRLEEGPYQLAIASFESQGYRYSPEANEFVFDIV